MIDFTGEDKDNFSITLIGTAGCGKSTIGKFLAHKFNMRHIDGDEDLVVPYYGPLQAIIDTKGEDYFMEMEEKLFLNSDFSRSVFSPGGSIAHEIKALEKLKNESLIIYLKISAEEMERRIPDIYQRGIVGLKNNTLKDLVEERDRIYSRYADLIIENEKEDCLSTQQKILQEIESKINFDKKPKEKIPL